MSPNEPFTPRSLVGMTMGARKRAAWAEYQGAILAQDGEEIGSWDDARAKYRIGQRLRPCPGCWNCQTTWQQSSIYSQTAVMHRHGCSHDDPSGLCCFGETVPVKMECDGSGVVYCKPPEGCGFCRHVSRSGKKRDGSRLMVCDSCGHIEGEEEHG